MTSLQRWAGLVALGLILAGAPALAQDALAAAKAQGLVGERPDGLVGQVGGGGDIQALVNQVNQARLEQYQAIAAANGTSVGAVQSVAGQRLIGATPPGQFVFSASGQWVQK